MPKDPKDPKDPKKRVKLVKDEMEMCGWVSYLQLFGRDELVGRIFRELYFQLVTSNIAQPKLL